MASLQTKNSRITFSVKITLVISILMLVIISTVNSLLYFEQRNTLYKEAESGNRKLVELAANTSKSALESKDTQILNLVVRNVRGEDDSNIVFAEVISSEGNVLAQSGENQSQEDISNVTTSEGEKALGVKQTSAFVSNIGNEKVMEVWSPIKDSVGITIGFVRIGFSLKTIEDSLDNLILKMIIITVICISISIVLSVSISRVFAKPVNRIVGAINNLASGDLTQTVDINSSDEIGQLAQTFNTMSGGLRYLIRVIIEVSKEVGAFSSQVSNGTNESVQISRQISKTIDELSSRFQGQVEIVNKIMSTIVHLDGLIQDISNNAVLVKQASDNTVAIAQQGGKAVNSSIDKMEEINKSVGELGNIIIDLKTKSEKINQIVQLITQISEQTNLLSLNAAIEAARAGEYGRGFAVVADEVRKLAEQSANASKEVSSIINEIQKTTIDAVTFMDINSKKTSEGSEAINVTENTFKEIIQGTEKVASMVNNISQSTSEQAKNSKEVVESVSRLINVAEEAAASTEEITASVEEQTAKVEQLANLSKELNELLGDLKLYVNKFKI